MKLYSRRLLTSFILLAAADCTFAVEEPVTFDSQYKLTIDASVVLKMAGEADETMSGKTILGYRRVCRPHSTSIFEVSSYIKLHANGVCVRESGDNKDRMYIKSPDRNRDVMIKDAPPSFQKFIKEKYENPIAVFSMDANGAFQQEPPVSENAVNAKKSGTTENFQLFHGLFPADKESWEEKKAVAADRGPASGVLKYQKQKPDPKSPNLIPVTVNGTLESELIANNGDSLKLNYTVAGEQMFDLVKKQYVTGKLNMQVTSTPDRENEVQASATSKFEISMAEVPTEK